MTKSDKAVDSLVLLISGKDVQCLCDVEQVLPLVEDAFLSYGKGESRMPSKVYLDLPEYKGDFRAMPAYSKGLDMAGMKWVNSHTDNPKQGLPCVQATLLLNDPKTAALLAIIEATELTSIRTGAAGGVAVDYLSSQTASRLALVGAGKQAYYQAKAILSVRPIQDLVLYDLKQERLSDLVASLDLPETVTIHYATSIEACVKEADIIVTTTPSREALVFSDWVKPGAHINAIGADAPGKQELDVALLSQSRVFVDDMIQACHSGEVNNALRDQSYQKSAISGDLAQVIGGFVKGRSSDSDMTIFDSTGLSIHDLAVGTYIYQRAKACGKGMSIDFS